ncbi:uncharacterized protein B0H18DRAFT_1215434 [Fomitopsis serialis]|uniref:uncharacterized protein n=1 Tax=Fomitopsis serialis TaxID=139415 RepID=UPI0020080D34|nr:uncharacterized protein B0H18DRAFT_1215434 [Neoantrodia serialis]KAH9915654.1 hypothetical protein B0H18DRAFT_1215434 [Neoantrodia serialis]
MATLRHFPLHQIVAQDSEESPFRRDSVLSVLVNALWVEDTPEDLKRGQDCAHMQDPAYAGHFEGLTEPGARKRLEQLEEDY